MSSSDMYNDGSRELQDRFDSRRIADRLEDKLTRTVFSADDRAFIESVIYFFVATADDKAKDEALKLVSALRREGFRIEFDGRGGSLKSQMKRADKSMARFALVLGETELTTRSAQLKPLRGGEPKSVSLDALPAALSAS